MCTETKGSVLFTKTQLHSRGGDIAQSSAIIAAAATTILLVVAITITIATATVLDRTGPKGQGFEHGLVLFDCGGIAR